MHRNVHVQIVVFGFFSSLFLIIFLCSSIRLTQLIILQRRLFGPRYIGDDFLLGAKEEGLTIVHFLNKLIVSCKEAVRFPFYFFLFFFIFYSN